MFPKQRPLELRLRAEAVCGFRVGRGAETRPPEAVGGISPVSRTPHSRRCVPRSRGSGPAALPAVLPHGPGGTNEKPGAVALEEGVGLPGPPLWPGVESRSGGSEKGPGFREEGPWVEGAGTPPFPAGGTGSRSDGPVPGVGWCPGAPDPAGPLPFPASCQLDPSFPFDSRRGFVPDPPGGLTVPVPLILQHSLGRDPGRAGVQLVSPGCFCA